ncbi:MAG: hypothetical protein JRJ70_06865 [Deltaproteobacteria bacterium]|nr:hypothetical protein [Deltaproteobacteria bacterium]
MLEGAAPGMIIRLKNDPVPRIPVPVNSSSASARPQAGPLPLPPLRGIDPSVPQVRYIQHIVSERDCSDYQSAKDGEHQPLKENTTDILRFFVKRGYWNHDHFCRGVLDIQDAVVPACAEL